MFGEVIQKEFPLRHGPKIGLFMVIEADQEGSNEIESSQVGKGIEGFDLPDHTTHAEQARYFSKHRESIQIKAETLMAKQLSDVEKISRAAAKIENAFRARQIKFNLANPADVKLDPAVKVKVFGPVSVWIFNGVPPTDLLETLRIDRFDHSLRFERKSFRQEKPKRVPSCARQALTIYEFFNFMTKSHWKIDHSMWRTARISTKLDKK
jgi:hypothetical protein